MIWRKKKQKVTPVEPESNELEEVKQELEIYKDLLNQLLKERIDFSHPDTLKLLGNCLNQAMAERCVEQEEEIKFLKKRITYLEFLE